MESWLTVNLCVACGRGERDVPVGDSVERRKIMAEFRDHECLDGAYLSTLAELSAAAERGEETATLGPSWNEIDWAGL